MSTSQTIAYAAALAPSAPSPKPRQETTSKYNFGTGHNDPHAIPVDAFVVAAEAVLRRDGQKLALYGLGGSSLGYEPLRQVVADKLRRHRGIDTSTGNVLITSGSLQGMDLVNSLLLERGDVVIIEQFTYVAALSKLKALGVEAISVRLDEGGIDLDALAVILSDLAATGRRAKYIYTIPTIQNPTGSIMSLERRLKLIALSRQYETPIFEDECYADLIWAGEGPPALYSLAPEQVLHIGSFSKTLAPALRLGYVVAPWEALGRMVALKSDGGTGALDQMVTAEFFSDNFESHVGKLTTLLKRKLDVLVDAINREFGTTAEVQVPQGGLYAWLRFPSEVDARLLAHRAAEAGVSINAGPDWAVRPEDGTHHIRLCFGLVNETEITEGITVLAQVCHDTFGIPQRGANRNRSEQG